MNNSIQVYTKIMEKATVKMLCSVSRNNNEESIVYKNCANSSGPVLCTYVIWILKEAEKYGIKHLYFLARDAKVMKDIAEIFIKKFHLSIQCHYLYCSRLVLRKSIYYIDREEALDRLCENGMNVTPLIIMKRTGLSDETIDLILDEIDICGNKRNEILSNRGMQEVRQKLKSSSLFDNVMLAKSKNFFHASVSYFKQNGLFQNEEYAFVDSGWSGSMQHCIRMILEKAGYNKSLKGFYFGMFRKNDKRDGYYHCFYFNDKRDIWNSVLFNHNLFECWCMANHGMTKEYKIDECENAIPVLQEYHSQWYEEAQLKYHIKYAEILASYLRWEMLDEKCLNKAVKTKVRKASLFPDYKTANIYGMIPFCDDSTESYKIPLARRVSFSLLIRNLLIVRLYTKFFAKQKKMSMAESFWPEATISYLPRHQRIIFRVDKMLEYCLKVLRKVLT